MNKFGQLSDIEIFWMENVNVLFLKDETKNLYRLMVSHNQDLLVQLTNSSGKSKEARLFDLYVR